MADKPTVNDELLNPKVPQDRKDLLNGIVAEAGILAKKCLKNKVGFFMVQIEDGQLSFFPTL